MKFLSVAISALLAFTVSKAEPTNKPLPFNGRCQALTMANVEQTYMLHILKMRGNSTTADPANYMKINPSGRSPAYNKDTGVMSVAVDENAIFKQMTKFRRSEIVQFVDGNPTGVTFFRASIRADTEIQNKYKWQVFFPESHVWEVFIDAKQSPPMLQFLADGSTVQFQTEFKYKTWYNVGIAVDGATGLITFFASAGNGLLKKVVQTKTALAKDKVPKDYEIHFGMLYYSETENPPMVAKHQDVLQFNGVSVENVVSGTTTTKTKPKDTTPAAAPTSAGASPAAQNV